MLGYDLCMVGTISSRPSMLCYDLCMAGTISGRLYMRQTLSMLVYIYGMLFIGYYLW